jgi:hypothetical protein
MRQIKSEPIGMHTMYTGLRVHRNGRRCRAAITCSDRPVIADIQKAAVKKAIRKVENASGG